MDTWPSERAACRRVAEPCITTSLDAHAPSGCVRERCTRLRVEGCPVWEPPPLPLAAAAGKAMAVACARGVGCSPPALVVRVSSSGCPRGPAGMAQALRPATARSTPAANAAVRGVSCSALPRGVGGPDTAPTPCSDRWPSPLLIGADVPTTVDGRHSWLTASDSKGTRACSGVLSRPWPAATMAAAVSDAPSSAVVVAPCDADVFTAAVAAAAAAAAGTGTGTAPEYDNDSDGGSAAPGLHRALPPKAASGAPSSPWEEPAASKVPSLAACVRPQLPRDRRGCSIAAVSCCMRLCAVRDSEAAPLPAAHAGTGGSSRCGHMPAAAEEKKYARRCGGEARLWGLQQGGAPLGVAAGRRACGGGMEVCLRLQHRGTIGPTMRGLGAVFEECMPCRHAIPSRVTGTQ
eukprot:295242-Chlamydomonas_euryale.AAC.7